MDLNQNWALGYCKKTSWLLRLDILLTILTVLLTFSYYKYSAVLDYNIGANPHSDHWIMEKSLASDILYFIFILGLFLSQIIVTLTLFASKLFRQGIIGVILVFIGIFVVYNAYKTKKPGIYYIFQGHTDRIKRDVDFKLIRDWGNSVDISKQNDYGIPKKYWPDFIKQLKAHTVFIEKKETIGTVVKFEWGMGPFVHWGLVVGPPDMEVPESINKSDLTPVGEYRVKITPGAYVWHDIK